MFKNANRIAWIGAGWLAAATQMTFAAAPELSAASLTVPRGKLWLLYGTALDSAKLTVFVAGNATNEFDAVASLQRHLLGTVSLPERPPADAAMIRVIKSDAFTAAMDGPKLRSEKQRPALVWAGTAEGVSRPLLLNRPEAWTLMPRQAAPGDAVRILGPNMGHVICLADAAGGVHRCAWAKSYSSEKGYTGLYERTLRVPTHAAAGGRHASSK